MVTLEEDRALGETRTSLALGRGRFQTADELMGLFVEVGHVAPLPFEVAAVLLGNAGRVHEGGEGRFYLCGREDEDLGRGDGVEPPLNPAPDGREEGRRADDLQRLGSARTFDTHT